MRKPKGESVARALVRAVESLSSLEPGSALEPESSCRWWDGLPKANVTQQFEVVGYMSAF